MQGQTSLQLAGSGPARSPSCTPPDPHPTCTPPHSPPPSPLPHLVFSSACAMLHCVTFMRWLISVATRLPSLGGSAAVEGEVCEVQSAE